MEVNLQQIKQAYGNLQAVLSNGRILVNGNALTGAEIDGLRAQAKLLYVQAEILEQNKQAAKAEESKKG